MSESERKDCVPPKGTTGSAKDDGKAKDKQQTPPAEEKKSDSEDIERAVFDGMQDLRDEKPK